MSEKIREYQRLRGWSDERLTTMLLEFIKGRDLGDDVWEYLHDMADAEDGIESD